MPIRLSDFSSVEKGDVLLVKSTFSKRVEEGTRDITYHWYGIVLKKKLYHAECYRTGAQPGSPTTRTVVVNTAHTEASFMVPEEWPDGIIALRTSLILRGNIDID